MDDRVQLITALKLVVSQHDVAHGKITFGTEETFCFPHRRRHKNVVLRQGSLLAATDGKGPQWLYARPGLYQSGCEYADSSQTSGGKFCSDLTAW